jgi:RNA polymerase primary sigma factor
MDSAQPERSSLLTRYFQEIREYPTLSREREEALSRAVLTGCRTSRDELVRSNLSFVVKVASEYRNLGLPLEDLLNEGNLGLIEAAHRYDASKGTKFITYAIWWIRKSILKALSDRSNLVRVPSYQMKKVREIRETEQTLSRRLGRKPDRQEISEQLERSLHKVDQALQFTVREVSLDHRVGKERDQSISEYLVDEESPNAETHLIRREDTSLVAEALRQLNEQEKQVVCYRFGMFEGGTRTLKQVGEIMHISRERVRQIECQAKARLRKIFDARRAIKAPPKSPSSGDSIAH